MCTYVLAHFLDLFTCVCIAACTECEPALSTSKCWCDISRPALSASRVLQGGDLCGVDPCWCTGGERLRDTTVR